MNTRRDFFKQLALGAATFSILPGAETYSRIWRPKTIVAPEWISADWHYSHWVTEPIFKKYLGYEYELNGVVIRIPFVFV